MTSILKNTLSLGRSGLNAFNSSSRLYHIFLPTLWKTIVPNTSFLAPNNVQLEMNCGFKVKGFLRRRCKDCFFVSREDRLHVICKTHPRHKQMAMKKSPRNTWILSHATQGKIRQW